MHVEKMVNVLQDEVKALKEDVYAHKKASSLTEASKRADDTQGSAAGRNVEELQKCVDALRVDHDGLAKQLKEEVVTAREHEDNASKAKDGAMMHVEKMVDALQDEVNTLKGVLNDSMAQTQLGKNEVKKKADALQDQIDVLKEAAAVQNATANNRGMTHVEKMVDALQDEVKALKEAVALQEIAHTKHGEAAKNYQDIVHKHRENTDQQIKEEMKKLESERTQDLKAREQAKESEAKILTELSDLKADVQHMKKSTSIDGDLHKGLADVENSVSECEAGVRTVLQSVEAVGVRIQQLERAHKQTDESAISRIAAQISELDEAMEVRENENASLDGRVEKMERHEAALTNRVSGLQVRVDDVSHQCKLLNDQTQQLDNYIAHTAATKEDLSKVQQVVADAATKLDVSHNEMNVSRVTAKVDEIEERGRHRDMGGEGSVTARSLYSEKEGSFYEFHDELVVASEGSARIRALAARVRGVTQSGGRSVAPSPIDPPRGSAANTTMSPSQITSPRSMLEETAERIREWEIRNQGTDKGTTGSDDDHQLQFV